MSLEPKWPVLAIEVVEQPKCQASGRPLEGGTVFKQVGARDDDEFGSNEPSGFKARVLSQPMPDCQIDRLSPQIDRAGARLHDNFSIRMRFREQRASSPQPSGR